MTAQAHPKTPKKTTSDGVLVIDKPRGPTSHDVIAKLRKKLGTREIGHAGTLDPMATGVLVVAIGEATKLTPYLTAADKAYEATLALGVETDTLDADGRVTARAEVPPATLAALERIRKGEVPLELLGALALEQARTSQIPPVFSAIKKGGEASHAKARRGEAEELDARPVVVHAIKLQGGGVDPEPWLAIALHVSKGYYVRALARDIARGLGTVGHLTALRRTASGKFTLDEALPLDTPGDELEARIIPLERAAERALPSLILSPYAAREAGFGRRVPLDELGDVTLGAHAWFDTSGRLVAIGELDANATEATPTGRVLRGFNAPTRT